MSPRVNYVCENCDGKGGLYDDDPNPLRDARERLGRIFSRALAGSPQRRSRPGE